MVRVIDARSGAEIIVGSKIRYPDGEGYDVYALKVGLFSAWADVCSYSKDTDGSIVPKRHIQPLRVRYMHPAFMFQKVAFFPS